MHLCHSPGLNSGDLIYKNDGYTKGKVSGLISTPELIQIDLTPDDQFLLLACDGLFDVITYKVTPTQLIVPPSLTRCRTRSTLF